MKKILESVGANVDDDKVKTVIAALKGKSLHEVNLKINNLKT